MSEDTVFALSSPVGGAIAIVRITGSGAYAALMRVFRCKNAPEHRVMNYGHVIDPESGETIDSAMADSLKPPQPIPARTWRKYIFTAAALLQSGHFRCFPASCARPRAGSSQREPL